MRNLIVSAVLLLLSCQAHHSSAYDINLIEKAKEGDVGAQIAVGDIEFENENYETAMRWYWLAAAQGNPIAQSSVGVLYRHGLGVSQNCSRANEWFLKAAEGGSSPAREFLENQGVVCTTRILINRIFCPFTQIFRRVKIEI